MYGSGEKGLPGFARQIGTDLLQKHRFHFRRRAGQEEEDFPICLHCDPRGGAIFVLEHGRALRYHCLFAVVFAHGPAGAGKIGCHPVISLLVPAKLFAQGRGGGLLGNIVVGGTESTGHNQQVAAGKCQGDRLFQPLGVVPHHRLMVNAEPQGRQLPGQESPVGIHDVPQQKLCAHT